ncbi:dynein regulatory complex protein 8 isoform X7 [Taeniopygia guttata]|uniref:dynein regulatory complex protein 8 isoform X7 n=1 Tax=Taeniopygia guttata TaxID=59729 RepID=UPI003BB9621B
MKKEETGFFSRTATTNAESVGKETCVKSGKREIPRAWVGAVVLRKMLGRTAKCFCYGLIAEIEKKITEAFEVFDRESNKTVDGSNYTAETAVAELKRLVALSGHWVASQMRQKYRNCLQRSKNRMDSFIWKTFFE